MEMPEYCYLIYITLIFSENCEEENVLLSPIPSDTHPNVSREALCPIAGQLTDNTQVVELGLQTC